MPWNWQLPQWPQFTYSPNQIALQERQFLLNVGNSIGVLKSVDEREYHQFMVEILSREGLESSKIEGEFLDRESLQSSIKRHFGIATTHVKEADKESRMAQVLYDVYDSFNQPLTHEMLWRWHFKLFQGQTHISDYGKYRTHMEPMQIVSRRYTDPKVFFEAPPSSKIFAEMTPFIERFNSKEQSESLLARAAIAHIYFESIHPFEDGNGRIGRLLVEKILSHGIQRPVLIAVSKVLENRKKDYYAALERCNRTLEAGHWVEFFADVILQAQKESIQLLYFLIEKSKMLTTFSKQLNPRQERVLLRMFAEGVSGFKGGLSAENYIAITKTSRATATRDLTHLVQIGALFKTGELRHTRYWLKIAVAHNEIN